MGSVDPYCNQFVPAARLELDLWVDGRRASWRAIGRTDTCSEEEHSYTTQYTATKNGRLRLAVLDLDHRDNEGVLKVTLLLQR